MARPPQLRRLEAAIEQIARLGRGPNSSALRASRAGVELPGAAQMILRFAEEQGPARVTELARLARMGEAATSRQVTLLEEAGLVRRERDPSDGRAAAVRVTAEGRRQYERLRAAADALMSELLADWSDTRVSKLARELEALTHDLTRKPSPTGSTGPDGGPS